MLRSVSLFILFNIFCMSCTRHPNTFNSNSGTIEYKGQLYDTVGNQFSKPALTTNSKIWYKDSLVIEEVRSVQIVEDAKNSTQTTIIENYRFNDLRSRMTYEYKKFSDTASLIRKYSLDDSIKIYGGWNFKFKRKLEYQGTPEFLSDTTIDQVNYKRIKLTMTMGDHLLFIVCYQRCDKKGTIFDHDPDLSKITGCPTVKVFIFSPEKKDIPNSSETNFLTDTLTNEELKVFAAWERNAKLNPVNKNHKTE